MYKDEQEEKKRKKETTKMYKRCTIFVVFMYFFMYDVLHHHHKRCFVIIIACTPVHMYRLYHLYHMYRHHSHVIVLYWRHGPPRHHCRHAVWIAFVSFSSSSLIGQRLHATLLRRRSSPSSLSAARLACHLSLVTPYMPTELAIEDIHLHAVYCFCFCF